MSNTLNKLNLIRNNNKKNANYINQGLYRLLYKPDMLVVAYEKIKSKPSNVKLDGFSKDAIKEIIDKLKNESYKFTPATRVYIPKPGSKEGRPIDVGSVKDKVLLEAIHMILEAIYEPIFIDTSHGFRPGRSCHTALKDVRVMFRGSKWFIEGDIRKYFNSINHDILIDQLKIKIEDHKFVNLIRKVLNAGYLEFRTFKTDLLGIPQGNIISPILSNIYLHPLDILMLELCKEYKKGNKRKPLSSYIKVRTQMESAKRKGDSETANLIRKQLIRTPVYDYNDPEYSRLNYVRYADDWLIGLVGPHKMAEEVREKIRIFLKDRLKLDLNLDKTLITSASKSAARFLGTIIRCPVYEEEKVITVVKKGVTTKQRKSAANIKMDMDANKVINKLATAYICNKGGVSMPKFQWKHLTHNQIIQAYNSVINGLFNYYSFIDNTASLARVYNILRSSAAKLLASKFTLKTQRQVFRKFGKGLKANTDKATSLIIRKE